MFDIYKLITNKVVSIRNFINEYESLDRRRSIHIKKAINRLLYNIDTLKKRHNSFKTDFVEYLKTEFTEELDKKVLEELKNKTTSKLEKEPRDEYLRKLKLINSINKDILRVIKQTEDLYLKTIVYKDKLLEIYTSEQNKGKIEKDFNKINITYG